MDEMFEKAIDELRNKKIISVASLWGNFTEDQRNRFREIIKGMSSGDKEDISIGFKLQGISLQELLDPNDNDVDCILCVDGEKIGIKDIIKRCRENKNNVEKIAIALYEDVVKRGFVMTVLQMKDREVYGLVLNELAKISDCDSEEFVNGIIQEYEDVFSYFKSFIELLINVLPNCLDELSEELAPSMGIALQRFESVYLESRKKGLDERAMILIKYRDSLERVFDNPDFIDELVFEYAKKLFVA